jgi:hypothetical protein
MCNLYTVCSAAMLFPTLLSLLQDVGSNRETSGERYRSLMSRHAPAGRG